MHPQEEAKLLEEAAGKIIAKAQEFGLDFYNMHFEICPAEVIYTIGAYGMPTRFTHWTFGKAYQKMKTHYDYNLSRIYELVINTDPCYAFLLEGNSLVQNKLVMAHVLGHSDFFKNNAYFKPTPKNMIESMAAAAERFRSYEFKYGREKVEKFLDAVISIQEHIDPRRYIKAQADERGDENDTCGYCGGGCHGDRADSARSCSGGCQTGGASCGGQPTAGRKSKRKKNQLRETPYDDLWNLDKTDLPVEEEKPKKIPPTPEKDLLLFLLHHARDLDDWQQDIISVIRQEMLYFWPQMETKIMNEGWATYWHLRIIREIDLPENEALDFAKMHAGVIQASKMHLNPYLLGLKIFEDIEKRWDNPSEEEKEKYDRPGGQGREKIFEVRETENDISFIRNYLTRELIEEMDLYLFKKIGYDWKITDKNWEVVRDHIVASMTNCGYPYIVVEDGDYGKRGDLYLRHQFEGTELDVFYLEKTLPMVYHIWGRQVHLETVLDNKKVLFSYNGEKCSKKFV
ncbi:MAG: SpoVR family protein [Bacillota bacterium]